MRYIKNLRSSAAELLQTLPTNHTRPEFANKAAFREWCADENTNHVFYSMNEGCLPSERISKDNPVAVIYGIVADYDAPVDWSELSKTIKSGTPVPPTWVSKTYSGYVRLGWVFESKLMIEAKLFDAFMKELAKIIKVPRIFAGFDEASLRMGQYFEVGTDWQVTDSKVPNNIVRTALTKAAAKGVMREGDITIPLEVIAAKVAEKFPNRWTGDFFIGSRGPLFWINDGIDREGCQVIEDGMLCFSERAGKGFMSWGEIFGKDFVAEYEQEKIGGVLDEYWYNGKSYYKLLHNTAVAIPRDQLVLELRQAGFSTKAKKGAPLSEVESAILTISNQNRVDEIAPVVFSSARVVESNGYRILNNATISPVQPEFSGDPKYWPFIHNWLDQLFVPMAERPATDYLYAWLQRFYKAVLYREFLQGQALLLVGPTNKGKSLLSNRVIAGLVGGFADASDYLSGQTKFNKDLARVPAWVIDDTTSAASFQDQRKATELIKRAVANPRVEYQAKYVDAISIPWTGRVIMSLNMDANSLSVIPAIDSSNRDKLLALRVADQASSNFPKNSQVEQTIAEELPYFARFLLDWEIPEEIASYSRFGVDSFIEESIASAAYDNSSRSAIAELVEFFVTRCRRLNEDKELWSGTLTEFQVQLHEFNNGRSVGMSHNLEFVRRGMVAMEESASANKNLRPVTSIGHGGGKIWVIDLNKKYDIANIRANHDN